MLLAVDVPTAVSDAVMDDMDKVAVTDDEAVR